MTHKFVPYCRHNIDENDIASVGNVLKGDWLTQGPQVSDFESSLANLIGAPTCVVSSGTAALHAVYSVLDLKPGDEIISTPITFIATQSTALLNGARVVFADIEADTVNLDPASVRSLITPRTRAVTVVDFAGHPADLNELKNITNANNILLIEDAAHSLGSKHNGELVGSQAYFTTFSLFATKNIATGEGGAVSSIHNSYLENIRGFTRQGVERRATHFLAEAHGDWYYEVQSVGLNYRLPDILCALGKSQLSRVEFFKDFRSKLFQLCCKVLSEFNFIDLPAQRNYADPMWHLFPARFPSEIRRQVFEKFKSAGISVQVNYIPTYFHPIFDKVVYPIGTCPKAEEFYSKEISLPMFVDKYLLSDEYLNRIFDVLVEFS